jgi:hypothetical protein
MAICKLTKAELAELQMLVDAYDSARSGVLEFLTSLQADWEGELDDKSEKWREGQAGQEAEGRKETLDSWIDELPDDVNGQTDSP